MAGITAAELLANKQEEYKRHHVNPGEYYDVEIAEANIGPNPFRGESLKITFKFLAERYNGNHISHILTFRNANGSFSPQFVDFVGLFYDLGVSTTKIDTDELAGKKCRILVEDNPKQPRWQKVSNILPISEN